jgi:hypothetical protein
MMRNPHEGKFSLNFCKGLESFIPFRRRNGFQIHYLSICIRTSDKRSLIELYQLVLEITILLYGFITLTA